MSDSLDLDAYLRRIGHDGGAPSRATLAGVQLAHAQAIAFENLDPLLGRPVRLDIGAVQEKLVGAGRGGYCFEHNTLLMHVLDALGFQVTGLAARVLMNKPEGSALPRTHMLLRVDLDDGPVLADVGFGGLTPTGPLRLETDIVQQTPHEPFRLTRAGEDYRLQVQIGGSWTNLYQFDLQVQIGPDYEMMNHYTATHPDSVFLNNLVAALPVPGRRYALRNDSFAVHTTGGGTERRTLTSAEEIRSVLTDVFGVSLPSDPGLDAVFGRFAAQAA